MIRYFPILAFIILIEYQVLTSPGEISHLSATGFILLSLYHVWQSKKGYNIKKFFSRGQKNKIKVGDFLAEHKMAGIIIGSVYAFLIALSIVVLHDFGNRIVANLFITATALIGLSTYEIYHKEHTKGKSGQLVSYERPNKIRDFTIPIIYLYTLSYLLSIHVGNSFAYQFVLVLAVLVLFDIIRRGLRLTHLYEANKINEHDFKHYLFHRWSKYLNYFITVWYFVVLHQIGVITETQQHILMYAFVVIFITFVNRMASRFSIRNFMVTVVAAGIITFIDPILNLLVGIDPPHYLIAIIMLVFFDIVDQYFHTKEYNEIPLKIWEQKAVIYVLATIFIVQLSAIEDNPLLDIESVFTSIVDSQESTMEPNIQVEDVQNAAIIRAE